MRLDAPFIKLQNGIMSKRFESQFSGYQGQEIFFQSWVCDQPKGTVLITHGQAEHSDCYNNLARLLNQERWNVVGWDLPGHGRSEGKRGYIGNFNDYVQNLFLVIQHLKSQKQLALPEPWVLFGHSMGGLITVLASLQDPSLPVKAVALSSPAMGLKMKVPKIKEQIGRFAADWFPHFTLHNEIKYRDLSRSEEQLKIYPVDSLRHDKISPAVYLGMLDGFERVRLEAENFNLPLMMLLAGRDPITDVQAARWFYEHISSSMKSLEIYPESLHEIFNDLDRDLAFEDLKKFLNRL